MKRSFYYQQNENYFTKPAPILALEEVPVNPCKPSPCGPNSICSISQGRPVCSCNPGFLGRPPYCNAECRINSECALDRACRNGQCSNPCAGTCGNLARCRVVNHNPRCSCPEGYDGDANVGCIPEESKGELEWCFGWQVKLLI